MTFNQLRTSQIIDSSVKHGPQAPNISAMSVCPSATILSRANVPWKPKHLLVWTWWLGDDARGDVCICAYICKNIYIYIHTLYVYMYYIYICNIYIHTRNDIYIYMRICISVYIYIYIHVEIHVYVYDYVYIHTVTPNKPKDRTGQCR